MERKLDLSKEYGIVLEGGGARGAYQIGAWKALREEGIRIRGVAGSSVGALNGALICMDDLELAEGLWRNISYSQVMDVDEQVIRQLKGRNWKGTDMAVILREAGRIITDRGIDISPLKKLIKDSVDEVRLRASGKELYATTLSLDERKGICMDLSEVPEGAVGDMLLASAYFPAFRNERLGGKRYMDGGGYNNVPLDVLLDRGYRDVIVIRIYGWGVDREREIPIPPGVSVHHVAPRQSLGGILEFDRAKARRNMKLGYFDAKRMVYGLAGKRYYIDAPGSEACCFDCMMSELELLKPYLGELAGREIPDPLLGYRPFTEEIFPLLAGKLGLSHGWDYRDLYLAVLETLARKARLNRFRIYTAGELYGKILTKLRAGELSKLLDSEEKV